MKRLLLTTVLSVGAIPIASAQPATYPPQSQSIPPPNQSYRHGWETLGERLPAHAGRQDVFVTRGPARFSSVRVAAERGEPVIRRVEIEYVNGRVQRVHVNRPLPANAGATSNLDIALRGSGHIKRVTVITDPWARGQFGVFAS
jgi:hypothetical protein